MSAGNPLSVLSHGLFTSGSSGGGPAPTGTWEPRASTRSGWVWWGAREDVTLRARTALPGTYTNHTLSATGGAAKRRAPTTAETDPSAGVYTNARLNWLLPAENLPANVAPVPGDIILDADAVAWTVLSVMLGKWENTYHCQTISLALANGLSVTGTLSRPSNAQDAAGRQSLATYSTVGTSACRVHPVTGPAAGNIMDRRTAPELYAAFLATPLDARAKDRFTASGVTYTVTGVDHPQQLDKLQELQLELIL